VEDATTRASLEARLAEMEHELVALGLVAATVGAAAVVTVGVGTALLDGPLGLVALSPCLSGALDIG
jgi:hypothetical protein